MLYRGAFLAGDEAAWAIACLEGELQVDDTVEAFYRQLMTLQARLGRLAEVQGTYRRCRQVLDSSLQLRPSPSTEALLKELSAASSGLAT